MDSIFHEKQEGSLCAQHCLNSLLQGAYFSAVDLASIAQELDDAERAQMAEGGVDSQEYLRFQAQPSSNMDDSGFFSIQVISRALSVWGLLSIPIGSSEAGTASIQPQRECAFICNFREHWLTIRKLGNQWFNLNSLLTGPELISDTYLGMFLAQLQKDGYSIFVIRGSLPDSEADQLLRLIPAVQTHRPKLLSDLAQSSSSSTSTASTASTASSGANVTQDDLQRALEASRKAMPGYQDNELQEAIKLSLQDNKGPSASKASDPVNIDEVRRKREAYFNRQVTSPDADASSCNGEDKSEQPVTPPSTHSTQIKDSPSPLEKKELNTNNSAKTSDLSCSAATRQETGEKAVTMVTNDDDLTETAMLEAAIRMSMESVEQKT